MSDRPPPGWYPDPEMAGTQRYWDGERWTDHRAPQSTKSGWVPSQLQLLAGAATIVLVLGFVWTRGAFDGPLSEVGLNFRPCVELLVSGNKLCGDELEQACEERFFSQVNAEECREVE